MSTVQRRKKKKHLTRTVPLRPDGFIELSWYPLLKFFATKANGRTGVDIILVGPASSGKTTGAYMLANDLGYEIVVLQCHRRIEVEEFRGTRSIVQGKGGVPVTGFDPGALTHALQLCAKPSVRGVVFLIDEVNLVDPAMLAILNNLTQRDAYSCLVIPELRKSYARPSNFILIGTMNAEYAGTHTLSEAFVSRIVKIECSMMAHRELRAILLAKFPANRDMVDLTVRTMTYVEAARVSEQHQWEPDLRTMFQFLDLWLHREPKWRQGFPLVAMSQAFEQVIGPKIGWRDTFAPIRQGLIRAITTALGSSLPLDSPDEMAMPMPITETDDAPLTSDDDDI